MNYRNKNKSTPKQAGTTNNSSRSGKQKRVSSLNPADLTCKAQVKVQQGFQTETYFTAFPLNAQLLANIKHKGFETLTKIQEESISYLLEGRDMVALSSTGSGKTAAFLIPIIEKALKDVDNFSALVVAPTRELALQIAEEFEMLTKNMPLRSASFIGGTSLNTDRKNLLRRIHLHIGTPGRLLDLAGSNSLNLRAMNTLVLDEFDKMLDMGFVKDIKKIVQLIGSREQTMLFSATVSPSQKQLVASLVKDPIEIEISPESRTHTHIEQETVDVPEGADKFGMLNDLFQRLNPEKVILFTETKRLADRLAKKLNRGGITAGQIHGDKSQNYRVNMLNKFKSGDIRVLVATDVA
ncbi:DEAD/DEAH box helicase, partial [Echinicola sediminis]